MKRWLGVMLLLSTGTAHAAMLDGFNEITNCTTIAGWAWDAIQPTTPVSVDIYDGTTLLTTVLASNFRQDLLNAGIGDGKHGFQINTPAALVDTQSHTVTIKYAGTQTNLSWSPQTLARCRNPFVSVSSTSLTFGPQAMNSVSAVQTVTVSNTGTAALTLGNVVRGGTNPGQFTIASSSTCVAGASIAAGASCTVDAQFSPTTSQAAGTKVATITLTDNANLTTQVISLSGTTVNAPNTTASLSAPALNYAVAPQGSGTQTLTISNTGTLPLVIYNGSITLTGTNAARYALLPSSTCLSPNGVSVAVGGSCTLDVQYTSSSTAVSGTIYGAAVSLALNTADAPLTVSLNGQLARPIAALSSTSLTFGPQAMNSSSPVQTVTVSNTGTAALNISAINKTGVWGQFPVASSSTCVTGASIAAGASCTFDVQFSPTTNQAAGAKSSTITLTDNDSTATQTISLSGTTVNAPNTTASLSTTALNYAVAPQGSGTQTLTISNTGTLPLVIYNGSVTLTGTNAARYTLLPSSTCLSVYGVSVAVGGSCTLDVQYTSSSTAVSGTIYGAAVSLALNTADAPLTVSLNGQLARPIAALSSTSLTFGPQAMNSSSPVQTVTLSNTGTAALVISSIVKGAPNPGQFTIAASSTCVAGASIAAGASCTVDAQFSPTTNQAAGAKSSTITLTDNDSTATQVISLSGTTINAPNTTANLSQTSLAYYVQAQRSGTQTLTISNSGTLPLVIYTGSVTLTGTNAAQYTLLPSSTCLSPNGVSVAVGGSCTLDVQYTSSSTAVSGTVYGAAVSLALNTADAPLTVSLTGKIGVATTAMGWVTAPTTMPVRSSQSLYVKIATSSGTAVSCDSTPGCTLGSVRFLDGTTKVGDAAVTSMYDAATASTIAVAKLDWTPLTTGTHNINANYLGTALNLPSSTTATANVTAIVPDAPSINAAIGGNARASISFTSPLFDGGSPITSYTVTSNPGGMTASCSTSPCLVTGLANATTYTFTVQATNAVGTSVASAPSNGLTITAINQRRYNIHTDHLDTPRQITDTSGNVVWQWDNSDPFGSNPPNENPSGLGTFKFPLRYTGMTSDPETNTYYNVNRDYDSATGRYIQSDPIGLKGGINTYTYVGGNPLRWIDPSGLITQCELNGLRDIVNKYGVGPKVGSNDIITDSSATRGLGHNDYGGPIVIHTNPSEPEQYSGSVVQAGQAGQLIQTGLHENVHQGQSFVDHTINAITENLTRGTLSTAQDITDAILKQNPNILIEYLKLVKECDCGK